MPAQPDLVASEPPPVERRSFAIGLVNPDKSYREFVGRLLAAAGHRVVEARDRREMQMVLASHRVDCIILDYDLGQESGLEAFTQLRGAIEKDAVDQLPPVIMLTGAEDDRVAIAAFRLGLDDLVPKRGMQASDLIRAISDVVAKSVAAEQQRAEIDRSRRLATVDGATGLLSRREVERRLVALSNSADRRGGSYAVLVATVDQIQSITDRFGMTVGDRVLNTAASRLQKSIRPDDICGRYGDATFLYAVDADPTPEVLEDLRARLIVALSFEVHVEGFLEKVAPRIGLARFPTDANAPDHLVTVAVEQGRGGSVEKKADAPPPEPAPVVAAVVAALPSSFEPALNSAESPVAAEDVNWADRRRHQRTRVLKRGNLALSDGREMIDCMVRDISDGGARLLLVDEVAMPQTFRLLISDSGRWRTVERCWEHWPDVGVRFIS